MEIKKRNKAASIIPVSAMADIAFLLLIFFMISSIADPDKDIDIELPQSRISLQENEKYFNIWVSREGDIYFGGKKGNPVSLATFSLYKMQKNPQMRALIRASRRVPYKHINDILEALKEGGCHNVVFVSEKKGSKQDISRSSGGTP